MAAIINDPRKQQMGISPFQFQMNPQQQVDPFGATASPQPMAPFGANASPQPGFAANMSDPYNQVSSRPPPEQNPFAMFMQWMMSQQPQQPVNNVPENLAALRNDPQGDRNKAYMPGVMNDANPFANGAFLSNSQRIAREKEVLSPSADQPVFGMTGVQAGMGTPMMPPPYAPPMSSPFSGMMPKPAQGPGDYSLVPNGITGPMTPQNDAAAAAEYLRQAKPGGMQKYRR